MEHEDVIAIVKLFDRSSCGELSLQLGGATLTLRKGGAISPAAPEPKPATIPAPPPRAAAAPELPPGGVVVHSPMVGTLYRAASPGAAPFVEAGTVVDADATVCIIEVMKVMNTIKAGHAGRVVSILAENGTLVEFGQPLLVIDPAE